MEEGAHVPGDPFDLLLILVMLPHLLGKCLQRLFPFALGLEEHLPVLRIDSGCHMTARLDEHPADQGVHCPTTELSGRVLADYGGAVCSRPHAFVIAGPNGAGKSTVAPGLLRDLLGVAEYVNADLIAQGLSAFGTEAVAFQAGRVMLARLDQLARQRRTFAFETTLATRSHQRWLAALQEGGYLVDLVFLWLPAPEMAIARVAERMRLGGHDVPEPVIRRRYQRGLENFFALYRPTADRWWFLENAGPEGPHLIASGSKEGDDDISDREIWRRLIIAST